jgi:membrane protease YdiL (CAAX protease family)
MVLGFYGLMSLVAVIWSSVAGHEGVFIVAETDLGLGLQVALGLGIGGGTVIASHLASERLESARALNAWFREMLGPLSVGDVLVLAGASAVGEELLFRGAMQSSLGLVLTSIIFGLAHLPPRRELWPWTAGALAIGFAFGYTVVLTGSLLAPILAHFTINYFNLLALNRAPA